MNASTPTVYQHQPQYHTNFANNTTGNLYSDYNTSPIIESPTPTPSTSWTSEMSAFVDKLRDDAAAIVASSSNTSYKSNQIPPLDRRSVSQGMKLVAIAADEYEEGNDDVALDIYLSGIDKILMALPNKTDPRTKIALREKLQSVEERVGILSLACQYKQLPPIQYGNSDDQSDQMSRTTTTTITSVFSRISMTISTISSIGTTTVQAWEESNSAALQGFDQRDPIYRFKRFGRFVIDASVTCAVLIKQSPIPDLVALIIEYLTLILSWFDHQYDVRKKMQMVGIECIKMLLDADEQYHLHELASETLYMLIAASLKAAVAFKESPSYGQSPPPTSPPPSGITSESIGQIDFGESSSNATISPSPPSRSLLNRLWYR
ncbi:hypothetical protein DM01DRAFT_316557 [Hesseltinella vesiculosa]|uniref:MIT domain-containing protein n=1 Tax=Hesseltinella vesiculosa TaxID=101127 RepID=A0A1X2GEH8_9FUNG|nr:hypothetical protein DM01DRAFT_316557 [Hesseltinella vesiculosa]